MIDAYYALNGATSYGIKLSFQMSSCASSGGGTNRNNCVGYPRGNNPALQGRNVLFTSDSTNPICKPVDCENRKACRKHTDCPSIGERTSNAYIPRFCAKRCVSGDCPIIGDYETTFLGFPDDPTATPPSHGYGICQDCWDCVYDDEVYQEEGTSLEENSCNRVCASFTPTSIQTPTGGNYYGICPGCNNVNDLMDEFRAGRSIANFDPKPRNFNEGYKMCTEDAQCGNDDDGTPMFCAIECDTAKSTLAAKPGIGQYCNDKDTVFPGGMAALQAHKAANAGRGKADRFLYGYCQPCTGSCSPERLFENFDQDFSMGLFGMKSCLQVCGTVCPRCFMDQLCVTNDYSTATPPFRAASPTFAESGYTIDTETYLDASNQQVTLFAVPNTAYSTAIVNGETLPARVGSHETSFGPYPKAGCWYNLGFPGTDTLQAEYMACLRSDDVVKGIKSPSICN